MTRLDSCRVGNREWGLRPQTPPPTEMGVVVCVGTAKFIGSVSAPEMPAVHAAPLALSGWWFGCPGAGPIRACHRLGLPAAVLTSSQGPGNNGQARAWAGERIPGPPACQPAWIANGMNTSQAATSRWRAAWFALSGPRSRGTVFGVLPLLRKRRVRSGAGWATANGACAREPHHPPRWAFLSAPVALSGWWFGCPGAGPIRACHRLGLPATELMKQCWCAYPAQRERGPENGYPDRRPAKALNAPRTDRPPVSNPPTPTTAAHSRTAGSGR